MHRSHLPIHLWFWAAYLVATHTPGISAMQLQRQLGLKNDETAWFLLHRLRKAMVAPNRELLKGIVEADETHIGGPEKGKKGRGVAKAENKALIAGAIESDTRKVPLLVMFMIELFKVDYPQGNCVMLHTSIRPLAI